MISGGGTNLQALIDATAGQTLAVQIVLVGSNMAAAYGLVRAQNAGIPTLVFPLKPYKERGREAYDAALAQQVAAYAPDLIVLAGWMHILSPAFITPFAGRIINLHPALPGAFAGKDAIARAFAAFQRGEIDYSGVMVHEVIAEVDAGAVLLQEVVPLHPDDTLDSFAQRIHAVEQRLLVAAVKKALDNS
ncbi:MAG: phosphoribosylglycinamide formyltransferase [Chloroflexi bacterium]|nr:phosphoribosylglycinamide formyltransferase [Chloroflexota bacterium]